MNPSKSSVNHSQNDASLMNLFLSQVDKTAGLNQEQVEYSRRMFGANFLTPPPRTPLWLQFLEKFKDPTIILLSCAALVSILIGMYRGHYIEGIGIILAIIIATGVAFYSEYKSNKEFDLLNMSKKETAKLLRNGKFLTLSVEELVAGDIVILNMGDKIPSDGIVIKTVGLYVDQSMLTGESNPVKKALQASKDKAGSYAENMVYKGTLVSDGSGIIMTTAVGDKTEMGVIAHSMTEEKDVQTPLQERLESLSKLIGKGGMTFALLIFVSLTARLFIRGQFTGWNIDTLNHFIQFFMIAVTIIVVAVPEGLPMMVAMSLAINMRKMAKANCLVKKLEASETIGSATVICTDKTGTLTQNKMKPISFFSGGRVLSASELALLPNTEEWNHIIQNSSVNSTAHLEFHNSTYRPVGNATETALLGFLYERGVLYSQLRDSAEIVRQIPFSSERKRMTTLVSHNNDFICYEKGAPNILLKNCSQIMIDGKTLPIDSYMESIKAYIRQSSSNAQRVLAFTIKKLPVICDDSLECCTASGDHIFCGLVSIADPLRPEASESVELCKGAGIDVKMLTGDDLDTALSIAKECKIVTSHEDLVMSHDEFSQLTDEELDEKVKQIKVLARSRPLDKLRLVKSLHRHKEVVGVTGDGTNDAPALKRADVGISMGKSGTEVAKEASDIVLVDDNFKSIVTGVLWGRTIYENIQRLIQFQLTVNVAALITAFLGPFLGVDLPLTVIQLLWVNIIMDTFAALALSSEPPKKDTLSKPPRSRSENIITPTMTIVIFITGVFITAVIILLMKTNFLGGGSTAEQLTILFTVFVMFQFWNEFNCRAMNIHQSPFEDLHKNPRFLIIIAIIFVVQLLVVQYGGELFRTTPISAALWIKIMILTSVILPIGYMARWIAHKFVKEKSQVPPSIEPDKAVSAA